jgi:hypothetical protein
MLMTCLNERIVGALFFMLSGYAFAADFVIDSPVEMTVANIAPMPVKPVAPIPEPQRYLQRYEMEYQPNQGGPFSSQIENFYSADVTHEVRLGDGKATLAPAEAPHLAASYLRMGPSTAPQISIIQLPTATLTLGSQPQRRLSLTVDDWVFTGTARLAVLHSHDSGATLTVRHGF